MSAPPAEQTDEDVSGLYLRFVRVCVCVCSLKVYGVLAKDKEKWQTRGEKEEMMGIRGVGDLDHSEGCVCV